MPKALVHPNKVWKKDLFISWMRLSFPSKVWAYLSLQIPHIKQWGTMIQIAPFLCFLNLPGQQASKSTTSLGITQKTPNKRKHHTPQPTSYRAMQEKSIWANQSVPIGVPRHLERVVGVLGCKEPFTVKILWITYRSSFWNYGYLRWNFRNNGKKDSNNNKP